MSEQNLKKSESIVGLLAVVGLVILFFEIYQMPIDWVKGQIELDLLTAQKMLTDICLFENIKDLINLDKLSQVFNAWIADLIEQTTEDGWENLGRKLLDVEVRFVKALGTLSLLLAVRVMVLLGAALLFGPAAICFLFLAARSRRIHSANIDQASTPFMQNLMLKVLCVSLLIVVICFFIPVISIPIGVTLIVVWMGVANIVVGRVQKM